MKDPEGEDQITDAVLSDDDEERLRYAGWAFFGRYGLQTKLRIVGSVGGVVTVGLLAITTVRGERLHAVLGTAPLSASVSASIVLATGLKFLTFGALGLVLAGGLRRRSGSDLDPDQLLGIEETASLLALGAGGLGILVGMTLFLFLATASPASPSGFVTDIASPVELPISYGLLAGWSAVVATGSFAASVLFTFWD